MSKRREAYLATSTMRATAHSLSLASSVLGFEIVELWSEDVDGKLHCTYVHCDDALLKKHPEFNVGHYPQHKNEHILSPKLCELAKKSVNKYHWRILEDEGVDDSEDCHSLTSNVSEELNNVYANNHLPFKTEMAYLVEGVTGTSNVFIVALSVEKKEFRLQKLKFLQGVAFAIYVAAFDLDEDPEDAAVRKESSHELDVKEHLPTKPLISVELSQSNVALLPNTPPTEGKNLGVWSRRHMSDASLRSLDKHTPRNLNKELSVLEGGAEQQSISSAPSNQSMQSQNSSRDKHLNALASSTFTATEEPILEVPSSDGIYYDDHKPSENDLSLSLIPEEDLAPTWVPNADFNYPVSQIPVHTELNCDLRLEDFTNVVHFADGSNAHVFSAYLNNRKVVIKMIKESELDNETAVREFDIEHGMLARMTHPNMIKILGAGVVPRHFMVLEYLEGGILRSILQENISKNQGLTFRLFRKPTFTYINLLHKARELAEVFNYLHFHVHPGASVLHRDLKPDNIGFSEDGTLKLLDFGLVTCVRVRDSLTEGYEMTGCTGSLRYMAPEVALRQPYNEKVDVYSYGVVLWQMARDRVPFQGLTKDDFMTKVALEGLRPKLDRKWPTGFSSLITRCWSARHQDRPSFSLILEELNRLITDFEHGKWGVRRVTSINHYDLLGFGSMGKESGSSDYGSNGKRRAGAGGGGGNAGGPPSADKADRDSGSTGFDSTGKGKDKDSHHPPRDPGLSPTGSRVSVMRENSGASSIASPNTSKGISSPATKTSGSWFS